MAAGEAVPGGLCAPRTELTYETGQTVGIWIMSDLHVGAGNVDYKLIRKEVEEAIKHKRRIVVNGDVFDAIIAHDKRFSPDVLHPRLQGKRDPLNAAVEWAEELFAGAEHLIDFIGVGNHETKIEKYGGTDLCKWLVMNLRRRDKDKKHRINFGGISGFCVWKFSMAPAATRTVRTALKTQRLVMFYHHGAGGAAPVTGGLIDFFRKQTWVHADVITMGHRHGQILRPMQTLGLSSSGSLVVRKVVCVQTGAYMDTYQIQSQKSYRRHGRRSNYAADNAMQPMTKGGALLSVTLSGAKGGAMDLRVTM